MLPAFLITIDTEGDDLWSHPHRITTNNAAWLPRFQDTCERHGLVPTYLTSFEMTESPQFRHFARGVLRHETAEIGMHLHAWNSPPLTPLTADDFARAPYLFEHSLEVMEEKVRFLTDRLSNTFECEITSHRAGRYGFDGRYARILERCGYRVDCSVTPGVSWKSDPGGTCGGPDFRRAPRQPYFPDESDVCRPGSMSLLEVPVTIVPAGPSWLDPFRSVIPARSVPGRLINRVSPPVRWLDPNGRNRRAMLELLDLAIERGDSYVEFMLHSSELMPGGSPTFPTPESVARLYEDLEALFAHARGRFRGVGLTEFAAERTGEFELAAALGDRI